MLLYKENAVGGDAECKELNTMYASKVHAIRYGKGVVDSYIMKNVFFPLVLRPSLAMTRTKFKLRTPDHRAAMLLDRAPGHEGKGCKDWLDEKMGGKDKENCQMVWIKGGCTHLAQPGDFCHATLKLKHFQLLRDKLGCQKDLRLRPKAKDIPRTKGGARLGCSVFTVGECMIQAFSDMPQHVFLASFLVTKWLDMEQVLDFVTTTAYGHQNLNHLRELTKRDMYKYVNDLEKRVNEANAEGLHRFWSNYAKRLNDKTNWTTAVLDDGKKLAKYKYLDAGIGDQDRAYEANLWYEHVSEFDNTRKVIEALDGKIPRYVDYHDANENGLVLAKYIFLAFFFLLSFLCC